jgi:hypothetical protein
LLMGRGGKPETGRAIVLGGTFVSVALRFILLQRIPVNCGLNAHI